MAHSKPKGWFNRHQRWVIQSKPKGECFTAMSAMHKYAPEQDLRYAGNLQLTITVQNCRVLLEGEPNFAECKFIDVCANTRSQIDKTTKNFLTPHHPRTARFYLLPKIHKPGNHGRPIMSSNGAPTKNISRFVDYFLQPCVSTLPSYIRDTTDFINRLRRLPTLPPGTLRVTLDVTSLFTNIPHEEGITACKEFLNLRDLLVPSRADLCHLIRSISEISSFSFNEEY